jgi:hypothetical protein
VDPQGSAISFQGMRGYTSAFADLKFTYSLTKGIVFFK